jgi:hypothetical protein
MLTFRQLRESHYPTQGSSVEYPEYKEMDMENLVKDAIGDMPEDDGPHTSKIADPVNFQTVDDPSKVINQSSSQGNREHPMQAAPRMSGKPFKNLRKKMRTYGGEDFSGAVAGVAIGESVNEAVKDEADKGEYDYEGDMTKSSLRTIIRNAQIMLDMLGEDDNLPEWVQSKITLAEDYISTASNYMQSEMNEMKNPCWKGYRAYGTKMKNGKEVPNCAPIKEGSARAGYTKRGMYAKSKETHEKSVAASEKSRGVETSPKTDARKYGRTHTDAPYNSGESDRDKAEKLRKPKKQVAVKLPVKGDTGNERISDVLNHPLLNKYKK